MPFRAFPKITKHAAAVARAAQAVPLGAITSEARRLGAMQCTIDHAAEQLEEAAGSPELAAALDAHCKEHGLSWDQYDPTTLVFQADKAPARPEAPEAKPGK
jgi:hypothetical protein